SPRSMRAEIPPALEEVVLRCLEKDRERRFADAAELGAALSPFRSSLHGGAASAAAPRGPESAPYTQGAVESSATLVGQPTARSGTWSGFARDARVRRSLVTGALVFVGAVVGGGALLRSRSAPPPSSATATTESAPPAAPPGVAPAAADTSITVSA